MEKFQLKLIQKKYHKEKKELTTKENIGNESFVDNKALSDLKANAWKKWDWETGKVTKINQKKYWK